MSAASLITTKSGAPLNNVDVVCDVEGLMAQLEQIGLRAVRGVSAMMKVEAEAMRDKARSNAPVDKGGLEEAIKSEAVGGGRNQLGQFERVSYKVFVDGAMPGADGRPVSDYATIMHEELAPYGTYKLGPKSLEKAAAGNEVGAKYLERAVEERRAIVYRKARAIVDGVTKA